MSWNDGPDVRSRLHIKHRGHRQDHREDLAQQMKLRSH